MMKRPFLLLSLTAVLAACTESTPPVAVSGVQVTGNPTLVIGKTASLSATVRSGDGTVLTGQAVSWVSSDPDLVTVDATGTITARHFSVNESKKTVTITATAGGKSGSFDVLPYGFDMSCGTYTVSTDPTPDIAVYTRFRNADGSPIASDADYTVTGPAGFNEGAVYRGRIFQRVSAGGVYGGALAVSGTYSATATVAGITYSDTCTVDASQVLGFVSAPTFKISGGKASYSGTAASNTTAVYAVITADLLQGTSSYGTAGAVLSTPTFSLTGDISPTLPSGTYQTWIFARNYSNTLPMPDTVLMSATAVGNVTIP